jgi:outer membrane receptor protein involved in Fe transport
MYPINDPLISNSKKALSAAISALCAGIPLAQAQDADQEEAASGLSLEEVIVTASKRGALNVQDVPISITAFTNENIRVQGLKKLDDYFGQIPSLTFGRLEPGGTNVIMRGCAISGVAFGNNPTTGVYFDEQPITNSGSNPDPRLIDIERVEALAGPQGTTFGDASQCGTLRIITNKPVLGESSSWLDISGASVNDGSLGYDFSAMLNVPLGETVALRLVGFSAHDAGYIDNVLAPSPGDTFDNAENIDKDINGTDVFGGRAAIRWEPDDTWGIDFQLTFQDTSQDDGFGDADISENFFEGFDIGKWEQVRYNPESWSDQWYQLALTTDKDLGWGVWTATGSYFERKTSTRTDATTYLQGFQQATDYYNANNPDYIVLYDDWGGDPHGQTFTPPNKDKRTTFETRLASSPELSSRWSFLVGAFYNKSKQPTGSFVSNVEGQSANCSEYYAAAPGCTNAFTYLSYLHYYYFGTFSKPSDNWWTGIYTNELTSKAGFGEVTFNLTENFSITAGGRWYEIKTDRSLIQGSLLDPSGGTLTPNCGTDEDRAAWQVDGIPQEGFDLCFANFTSNSKETGFVPKFNATWKFTDQNMVYFTYSEGFRNGGANGGRRGSIFASGGEFDQYESDQLLNYEIGTKNTFADGTVLLNVTFYRMDWKDIQIQTEDPDPQIFATGILNFPEARIYGVESNFSWLPVEQLTLSGTLGYNNAELANDAVLWEGTENETTIPEGNRLPLMPEWKFSLNARWDFNSKLWGANPFTMATWTFNDDSLNSLGVTSGVVAAPPRVNPSFDILNVRLGLEGDNWSAQIFVDNLLNEYANVFFSTRWTQLRAAVLPPRTIGINFRKDFSF